MILDAIVILVLGLFMLLGYRRGLIMTVFRLVSFVLAIILASLLYPVVAQWLRGTQAFGHLQAHLLNAMGLEELVQRYGAEVFQALPLPDIMRNALAAQYPSQMLDAHMGTLA